jgi:hypothetical protein
MNRYDRLRWRLYLAKCRRYNRRADRMAGRTGSRYNGPDIEHTPAHDPTETLVPLSPVAT